MTTIEDTVKIFSGNGSSEAQELYKLLKTQAEILDMQSQKNGNQIYVKYSSAKYFNFGEITHELYTKYGLVVKAFDAKEPAGTQCVWLCKINHLEN